MILISRYMYLILYFTSLCACGGSLPIQNTGPVQTNRQMLVHVMEKNIKV